MASKRPLYKWPTPAMPRAASGRARPRADPAKGRPARHAQTKAAWHSHAGLGRERPPQRISCV
ncbi:hypothetical protein GCM10023209_07810 [Roseibacterium beibuensis]|uniref:Uncharacterized protein n=1 Tax=[Roseibacterium] beibuensis TaxID=1193142 RepID=A0ABP9L0U5_9RHOB